MLESRMIPVAGASLEVFTGGTGESVICSSHPYDAARADYEPSLGWENGMGRLVALNPRGTGNSTQQTPSDFTFRQHVEDLEAVRQHLGVDRWVFWGISGGGCIGLLYALTYPEALSGAIIGFVAPSGRQIAADSRSLLSPQHPNFQEVLAATSNAERHGAVLRSLRPELASAEWWQLTVDLGVLTRGRQPLVMCPAGPDERVHAGFEEFVTVFEVQDRLGEIQVPTLVVAGRLDPFFPVAHADLLRTGIPNADFVVLEETGHGVEPQSADLAKYRDAVRDFLARIPKRASEL